jgi:hypothetical protein
VPIEAFDRLFRRQLEFELEAVFLDLPGVFVAGAITLKRFSDARDIGGGIVGLHARSRVYSPRRAA